MLNELVLGRALYCRPRHDEARQPKFRLGHTSRLAWQWLMARP